MLIHMIVKYEKPYDETLMSNVKPFASLDVANGFAQKLNDNRSDEDHQNYVDYAVESYNLG